MEKTEYKEITFIYVCGQVLASSISNILGLVIGHPLDFVKVPLFFSYEVFKNRQGCRCQRNHCQPWNA